MRLLNVHTLKLESFYEELKPEYAILSHTWGEEEITFAQILKKRKEPLRANGYQKIDFTCKQAKKNGINYAWIDTCCIDKSSSAELSEAINSMFKWYKEAKICYAYLNDVTCLTDLETARWFTRGWTLQELIAPETLHFFDHTGSYIGDKKTLADRVSLRTNIPVQVLKLTTRPATLSVDQPARWECRFGSARCCGKRVKT
jgi:hypothetical protein